MHYSGLVFKLPLQILMFTSIPVVFTCVHVAPLLTSCTHVLDHNKYWLYVHYDVSNIPLKISVHACMHMRAHDHGFKNPPYFSSGYAPAAQCTYIQCILIIRMYTCTYVHVYTCTYVHVYTCTYVHVYTRTYVRVYTRTYVHTYVHT